jgi:probable HAF family extracellular repeat protein
MWPAGGGTVDVGALPGASVSSAYAINDRRQVVGASATALSGEHGFFWSSETGMVDLGTLGGAKRGAFGINIAGTIAGYADRAAPAATGFPDERAVVWTDWAR